MAIGNMKMGNGFIVGEMSEVPVDVPAGSYAPYHMYSHVGQNASNTTHHHEFGDVTICYDETSPKGEFTKKFPERRYVIICDQWTGKRLKVILPEYVCKQSVTIKREYGNSPNDNPLDGKWVARIENGDIIDMDKYQNDLIPRLKEKGFEVTKIGE